MATLKTLLDTIHESPELSSPEELKAACELIMRVQKMDAAQRDVLAQTFRRGPVWAGDIVSGSGRDALLADGFVAMVLKDGEEGFTACTYKGAMAYRMIQAGETEDRYGSQGHLLLEDIEAFHNCMDEAGAPRDFAGAVYTMWGRVKAFVEQQTTAERERVLAALNADLSWCESNGASYQNCIDFARLQKIVLGQDGACVQPPKPKEGLMFTSEDGTTYEVDNMSIRSEDKFCDSLAVVMKRPDGSKVRWAFHNDVGAAMCWLRSRLTSALAARS